LNQPVQLPLQPESTTPSFSSTRTTKDTKRKDGSLENNNPYDEGYNSIISWMATVAEGVASLDSKRIYTNVEDSDRKIQTEKFRKDCIRI
jgi:hypothetical protein